MTQPLSGAVATPHSGATAAAHDAFAHGGNAIDAALAAAAMLTVVYPNQCTVGGDAIALVGTADGTVTVVNGSGRSARTLDARDYAGADGFVPVSGAKSVTVPGLLSTWDKLATGWGRLPLAAALHRAADAAATGVPVAPGVHRDLLRERDLLAQDEGSKAAFFREDELLAEGELLRLPGLAESLRTIAEEGITAFYTGGIGQSIIARLRALGSDLTPEDFASHTASIEQPLSVAFQGEEYLSSGGNSQGTFFLSGLAALEEATTVLGHVPDPASADAPLIARILATAALDRDMLLGDPEHSSMPLEKLLDPQVAKEKLTHLLAYPESPLQASGRTYGRRTGDTVAIVTTDSEGNWVSLIQSAFHAFGSCITDPGTGILLHNRGASFSLKEGSPAQLAPGRRPPHTLMPVLVRKGGKLVGAHGTMGGRAQPQIHTHLALNLALGLSPEEAVAKGRWIVGQMEAGATASDEASTISVESGVEAATLQAFAASGFTTNLLEPLDDAVGHLQTVRAAGSGFATGSDPRSDGLTGQEA
ncbi:gamma-glutamyltransferase family protein [Paeniglutamicibacter sp. NPDC012692]|uniref:gamma-glutamyltransferase family protein n=1 Tax=Paeniglutamicibacter sp. NPDC012692 TaxID=3364388 RepID=UPI0036BE12A9